MKKLSGTLCALLIVLCSAGFASALPYEYYSGYQSVNEGSSYSFYFDLVYSNPGTTNSSLKLMNDEAIGYVPLQSAFVKVALYSTDWFALWESAKISLTAFSNVLPTHYMMVIFGCQTLLMAILKPFNSI